ncbi:SHOCT domain-containing protein [Cellulomonas sp. McL0617]|uniref:SHOCT domain-containing protein n=1 Tax=Cellulomonas sp. McL0617 TaxID=3415675 RepID=UPI003CF440CC
MGRPGLVGTMARTAVIAGTATAVSGSVSRHSAANQQQAAQAQAAEQQAMVDQAAPAPVDAAPPPVDIIGQLKQLGDLKAAGVLTDEEFAAAKAKLLG